MFLSDISIKRPVFATMMMVALVVLGIVSYKRLAIDEYPDVTYPIDHRPDELSGSVARSDDAPDLEPDRGGAEHRSGHQGDQLDLARGHLDRPPAVQPRRRRRRAHSRTCRRRWRASGARCRRTSTSRSFSTSIRTTRRSCRSRCRARSARFARSPTSPTRRSSTRLEAVPGVGGVNLNGGNERADPRAARSGRAARLPREPAAGHAGAAAREPGSAGRSRRLGATERLVRVTGRIIDPRRSRTSSSPSATTSRFASPTSARSSTAPRSAPPPRSTASPAVSLDVLKISGANTVDVADSVRAAVAELSTSAAERRQAPRDPRRLAGAFASRSPTCS